MGKKASDKKLNKLSTILEIITNLGTIASWVLGVGSAYLLNVQKTPVVVPGIDFTLDLGFQFALLISAMLGYIHFLQKYWEKNKEKQNLSTTFLDFSFWDLPRLRQPLLLIPVVIAFAIFIQVSIRSVWLLGLFASLLILIGVFMYKRFNYRLSPERDLERFIDIWKNDSDWFENWNKRIKRHLDLYIAVRSTDFYRVGKSRSDRDELEVELALHMYFWKFEFEEDLVLMKLNQLHEQHPYYSVFGSNTWILMPRKNIDLRKSNAQ